MSVTVVCPKCRYKCNPIPMTGKCPECGIYNLNWHVVDRRGFVRILKIKIFSNLLCAFLLVFSALVFLKAGHGPTSFGAGGAAGLFIVVYSLLAAIFTPIFGKYAVSLVFSVMALPFFLLAHRRYKKMKDPGYESHDPLG